MALTPTEREEHFFKAMIDAADGNTPEELEPTERKEHWYKEIIDAIKSGGGSGGGLPKVTASDAGKVLSVNDSGVWGAQEPIGKKFIVTLTPTAADFSGTMDKTVAEINAAYEAGQEIWFRIASSETTSHLVPVNHVAIGSSETYPKFDASVLWTAINMLINISTNYAGGDSTSYVTTLYPLTPAT